MFRFLAQSSTSLALNREKVLGEKKNPANGGTRQAFLLTQVKTFKDFLETLPFEIVGKALRIDFLWQVLFYVCVRKFTSMAGMSPGLPLTTGNSNRVVLIFVRLQPEIILLLLRHIISLVVHGSI